MRRQLAVEVFCLILCMQMPLSARTIRVGRGPGFDYSTIQAAIDVALWGDVVEVYPGTYHERIQLRGRDIVVRSIDPSSPQVTAQTVIDGDAGGPTVTFLGPENANTLLTGLTIQNGKQAVAGAGISGSPPVRVVRPNGGELLRMGTYYPISWTSVEDVGAEVAIELMKGDTVQRTLFARQANTGLVWFYPGADITAGTYRLRIRSITQTGFSDLSDSSFTIYGQALQVLTPNGGEVVQQGTPYPIQWTSTMDAGTSVRIEVLGGAGQVLQKNWPNVSLYWWTPGNETRGGTYKVKISSGARTSLTDTSDTSFTVVELPPNLDLLYPVGGEQFDVGSSVTLRWSYRNLTGKVKISVREAFDATDTYQSAGEQDITKTTFSLTLGSDYYNRFDNRIRVRIENNGHTDESGWFRLGEEINSAEEALRDAEALSIRREYGPYTVARIENCVIKSNDGGGIAWFYGQLTGSSISDNKNGPALFRCHYLVQNNWIMNNKAGGLSFCNALVSSCTIHGNEASFGGGLFGCDGVIFANSIANNKATSADGGGLYGCSGWVGANRIRGNSAAGNGGGLAACNGKVENNTITSNSAQSGGGLYNCQGEIRSNAIDGNRVSQLGGGLSGCSNLIEGNWVRANRAGIAGGGLALAAGGIIRNNLFVGNSSIDGGGLAHCNNGWIYNNTITSHTATGRGGGFYSCSSYIVSAILWDNVGASGQDLFDSPNIVYSDIQSGWIAGSISADPRFIDPDGPDNNPATYLDNDYRLALDSPCIDVGPPDAFWNDAVRPPGLGSEVNDMGTYGGPGNYWWATGMPAMVDVAAVNVAVPSGRIYESGQRVPVTGLITNQGTAATLSGFWVRFLGWNVETGASVMLFNDLIVGALAPGQTYNLSSATLILANTVAPGTYTIEMCVDPNNVIAEWDENNNTMETAGWIIANPLSNPRVRGFDFTPRVMYAGQAPAIAITGTLFNDALGTAPNPVRLELRAWGGAGFATNGPLLADFTYAPKLGPGRQIDLALLAPHMAPTLPPPGQYKIGLVIDPQNAIAESNEGDNLILLGSGAVTAVVSPRMDVRRWEMYR
jgi:hypothetical protein